MRNVAYIVILRFSARSRRRKKSGGGLGVQRKKKTPLMRISGVNF